MRSGNIETANNPGATRRAPGLSPAFRTIAADAACHPVDVLLALGLGIAAVAALLALGAANATARFALEVTLSIVIIVWVCDRRRVLTPMLVTLGICGLLLLQTVPLADAFLMWMTPISAAAWKVAHEAMPRAWGCVSVDPGATATAVRRLLLGLGGFMVARDLVSHSTIRWALGATLAGAAVLIWGLGLAFPRDTERDLLLGLIDLNGPIQFWVSPILAPVQTAGAANVNLVTVGRWRYLVAEGLVGDGFGPFISSNQFAGTMCLTVPFLLAFWLRLVLGRLPAWSGIVGTIAIGAGAVWTVGVRAGSRAGCAAFILGWMTFLFLSAGSRWWRWTLGFTVALTATVLIALAAAAYGFGPGFERFMPERVRPGLAALLADNRSTGIRVGLRMVRASPVAGTGLDTYADTFPRFVPGPGMIFYAHNDYVQWLAETGLIGGFLACTFIAFLVHNGVTWFLTRQGEERTLAAGGAAAVIGFASHEFFEWNLHLPAIALVASLAVALASPKGSRRDSAAAIRDGGTKFQWPRISGTVAIVATVLASAGFLARDMLTERTCVQLRTALALDRLSQRDPKQSPPLAAMEAAVAAGMDATRWDPGNADLPLLVGQLHLHLAARSTEAADREKHERTAAEWLTKARRRRAICFGLPELVPPTPRNP